MVQIAPKKYFSVLNIPLQKLVQIRYQKSSKGAGTKMFRWAGLKSMDLFGR